MNRALAFASGCAFLISALHKNVFFVFLNGYCLKNEKENWKQTQPRISAANKKHCKLY